MSKSWSLICVFLMAAAFCDRATLGQELPFVETFESMSAGSLDGKADWSAIPQANAQVQTTTVYAGDKACILGSNTMISRSFPGDGETNVWIDFCARLQPRAFSLQPRLSDDAVAGFYFDQSGHIVARSNDTWVTLTGFTIPSNTWQRFSINLDYNASSWAIFVAGDIPNELATAVATNLAFTSTATNTCFHSFRVKN